MVSRIKRFRVVIKALQQLGVKPLLLYAWYRFKLWSGWLAWQTHRGKSFENRAAGKLCLNLFPLPEREILKSILKEDGISRLIQEADEIVNGFYHPFGAEASPLLFNQHSPKHWTHYEKEGISGLLPAPEHGDIKFLWEAGRFGWVYPLARAYYLNGDERYPQTFWNYLYQFHNQNPPYNGVYWMSAQEVAIRLMALTFAAQIFGHSPSVQEEDMTFLASVIANHAARIPPTLVYARSQNNNHLISEAAGLFTAGLVIPEAPGAAHWRALGWQWFIRAVRGQIAPDGAYMQHSVNYQRLMLQTALWVNLLASANQMSLPQETNQQLANAALWLLRLLDTHSGHVPNLGANDGAYVLPLTICPFEDYRPVLQSAACAFLKSRALSEGVWDEMAAWFCPPSIDGKPSQLASEIASQSSGSQPYVLRSPSGDSWAYLRAAEFIDRPGHADQNHLDLWWRGLNLAQDAGTYLYNAQTPWDNDFTHPALHNTVTINGADQMLRAGRFLYLDWARAEYLAQGRTPEYDFISVQHRGYEKRFAAVHRRTAQVHNDGSWKIMDLLFHSASSRTARQTPLNVRLHWLLPDWDWEVDDFHTKDKSWQAQVRIRSPYGWVRLDLDVSSQKSPQTKPHLTLARAAERLYGSGQIHPTSGWISPTYGVKNPALSLAIEIEAPLPIELTTEWYFS